MVLEVTHKFKVRKENQEMTKWPNPEHGYVELSDEVLQLHAEHLDRLLLIKLNQEDWEVIKMGFESEMKLYQGLILWVDWDLHGLLDHSTRWMFTPTSFLTHYSYKNPTHSSSTPCKVPRCHFKCLLFFLLPWPWQGLCNRQVIWSTVWLLLSNKIEVSYIVFNDIQNQDSMHERKSAIMRYQHICLMIKILLNDKLHNHRDSYNASLISSHILNHKKSEKTKLKAIRKQAKWLQHIWQWKEEYFRML